MKLVHYCVSVYEAMRRTVEVSRNSRKEGRDDTEEAKLAEDEEEIQGEEEEIRGEEEEIRVWSQTFTNRKKTVLLDMIFFDTNLSAACQHSVQDIVCDAFVFWPDKKSARFYRFPYADRCASFFIFLQSCSLLLSMEIHFYSLYSTILIFCKACFIVFKATVKSTLPYLVW